jgi:hypothetical protein
MATAIDDSSIPKFKKIKSQGPSPKKLNDTSIRSLANLDNSINDNEMSFIMKDNNENNIDKIYIKNNPSIIEPIKASCFADRSLMNIL